MAKKRMFNNEVLDTDAFLDMPLSAQALYFHLNLRADDDGFIGNPQRVRRYIGASEDDLKLLVAKRFVIAFDDGVIVIKHWRMHNTIQKDRYKKTRYIEDLAMLGIKENKAYTDGLDAEIEECFQNGNGMETECKQNVSTDIDIGLGLDLGLDLDNSLDSNESNCPKLSQKDFRQAIEAWNELADIGVKPIRKLSKKTQRYERLRARLVEYGLESYLEAISNIRRSAFLQGKSGGKNTFVITFDWFVRPNNFPKVLDGNYNHDGDKELLDRMKAKKKIEIEEVDIPEIEDISDEEWLRMMENEQ